MTEPLNMTVTIVTTLSRLRLLAIFLLLIGKPLFVSAASVTHDMTIELRPDRGIIVVKDIIGTPQPVTHLDIVLNSGLEVEAGNARIEALDTSSDGLRTAYRISPDEPAARFELSYQGRPRFAARRNMGAMPQGEISAQGVYLDGSSAWFPSAGRSVERLELRVEVPDGWQSLSIGRRSLEAQVERWSSDQPHDDIYLIAGPFTRHATRHGDIDLSVWLLNDDPQLAQRYLAVMGEYIDHFSQLIGAYPYAKFAVVENRWQTGYGMPSFTLLGSQVIRLPFIPFTSLPHEILHNWWGNGVWIDYAKGNWSEGLTAYLADHWMQERRNKGSQYRLKSLQRYSNFAADGKDMALIEFVSRHNDASQSIGYSKSLMLFHMLRRELGDELFVAGLQRVWLKHRYTPIGFEQVVRTLTETRPEMFPRLQQWLSREGAPRLQLTDVHSEGSGDAYRLILNIRQDGPLFDLQVPVSVVLEGSPTAEVQTLQVNRRNNRFTLAFAQRPLRLDIDPAYDVLRYLDASEQPPALNRLFGSDSWLLVPSAAPGDIRQAWQRLAAQWQRRYPGLRVAMDDAADDLAADSNRIILGWDNRLYGDAVALTRRSDQRLDHGSLLTSGKVFAGEDHSVVLVNSDPSGTSTGFIGADSVAAIDAMARKLTHYGSYGRLVFDKASGRNLLKESLSPEHSTLSRQLGPGNTPLKLPQEPVLGARVSDGSRAP